ncbi:GNAT family N-acetyltransferase [Calothrix sp. HK-06]|nr:GNAT family N-acetyltransferase [Calothrix sp. HK-06]
MELIETFSTNCLIAERLQASHFAELCQMHQNSKVMATLGGARSDDVTQKFLQINLEHWNRYRYGIWIFRDKMEGKFVGRGGLRNVYVADNCEVELAYALMEEFWGQGLATEMAQVILEVGFNQLGLTNVVCFTLTTNRASQRVMEKVGFKYERDIIYGNLPHLLYRITK